MKRNLTIIPIHQVQAQNMCDMVHIRIDDSNDLRNLQQMSCNVDHHQDVNDHQTSHHHCSTPVCI
jgi:hypothetical protein